MLKKKILLTLSVSWLTFSLLISLPLRVFSQLSDYGPEIDNLYFWTRTNPDEQLDWFQAKTVDVVTDILRPADIDEYAEAGVITSTPGYHMCNIGFNLRLDWLGPQDGGEPGISLRKAIAHLLPKDTLIATLFNYVAVGLDTFVPPSLAKWYNPSVTEYDYNPTAAYNALVAGGWTYRSSAGTWRYGTEYAGGTDRTISILSPFNATGPTSFAVVQRLVAEMNGLRNPATNASTPLKAAQDPTDHSQVVIDVFRDHNFEMCILDWDLAGIPSFLYNGYHSNNDVAWSDNVWGLRNNALDDQLEIVTFSLDGAAQVTAAKQAQTMLSNLLPNMPIYSKNIFSAHQTDVSGVVLSPGVGIDQFWTWSNILSPRYSPVYVSPLTQIQGKTLTWCLGDNIDSLNPAQANSVSAWTCLGNIYDGLIATNPYTGADVPWLASSWSTVGPTNMTTPNGARMVNGMYIQFTLDPAVASGNVKWHDGNSLDADDIVFSWKYIWKNGLTNFLAFYEDLIDVYSPAANSVVAYWNVTSRWLLYDAAATATLFAPKVWGKIDTDWDGQNYLDNGDLEGDVSIRDWQPELYDYGNTLGGHPASTEFPWLTQVVGTGPFVFYKQYLLLDVDLFAFDVRSQNGVTDPDLHYWKTTTWISSSKTQWFHEIGDVDTDGSINVTDIERVGQKFGQTGIPGWIPEDVVREGVVNVYDLWTVGKNYGKVREY